MTITLDGTAGATISGDMSFNSGYGSAAVAYGCRAWVNFNSTGTVAIRGSGNVTSITDSGVGLFIVNFTNAMPDVNYSVVGTAQIGSALIVAINAVASDPTPLTTTQVPIRLSTVTPTLSDSSTVCVSIFR